MPLTTPVSFREAVAYLMRKGLLPTNAGSAEIADWSAALRSQSVFSAHTLLEAYLEDIRTATLGGIDPQQIRRADRITADNPEGFVNVGLNDAQAREFLRNKLKSYGVGSAPDKYGTIEDLRSDPRLNLVVQMNKRLVQGAGQDRIRQEPALLAAYPGYELFRAESRKEHRNWHERAKAAAAQTGSFIVLVGTEGVIALKNDPFWEALSAFGTPYAPLDFNSGMELKDVSRARMLSLGFTSLEQQPRTGLQLKEAA